MGTVPDVSYFSQGTKKPPVNRGLMHSYETTLFSLNDFTVLVVAAIRAHAMRQLDLAALWARAASGSVHAVVGATTGASADTTHSLFRYCHVRSCSFYMIRIEIRRSRSKHAKRYSSKQPNHVQAAVIPSPKLLKRPDAVSFPRSQPISCWENDFMTGSCRDNTLPGKCGACWHPNIYLSLQLKADTIS